MYRIEKKERPEGRVFDVYFFLFDEIQATKVIAHPSIRVIRAIDMMKMLSLTRSTKLPPLPPPPPEPTQWA